MYVAEDRREGSLDGFGRNITVEQKGSLEAAHRVRRKEHKILKAAVDDPLAGTRHGWLRNPAAMEPKDRRASTWAGGTTGRCAAGWSR